MAILIVDDAPDQCESLQMLLRAVGYDDVRTALSARLAFGTLGIDDPDSRGNGIDVILMDINMPFVDGIEAVRRIRSVDRFRDIPIIMVTGNNSEKDLVEAFAAGANDYVTKPAKMVELLARLRSALALKRELDRRKANERDLMQLTWQLQDANRSLERLSTLDGLTGIANRRSFDAYLGQEWRRAAREAQPLSLIMVDVDHFKDFNDYYGHQSGDDCLKAVASALGNTLRRAADYAARYGGEEFAIVLPYTGPEGAGMIAEALREKIEGLRIPHARSSTSRWVTISLGSATTLPDRQRRPDALIATADQALYEAKEEGRNRVKQALVGAGTECLLTAAETR